MAKKSREERRGKSDRERRTEKEKKRTFLIIAQGVEETYGRAFSVSGKEALTGRGYLLRQNPNTPISRTRIHVTDNADGDASSMQPDRRTDRQTQAYDTDRQTDRQRGRQCRQAGMQTDRTGRDRVPEEA